MSSWTMCLCMKTKNCKYSTLWFLRSITYSRSFLAGERNTRADIRNLCRLCSTGELTEAKHSVENWTRLLERIVSKYRRSSSRSVGVSTLMKMQACISWCALSREVVTLMHYYHASWGNVRKTKCFLHKCFA